MTPEITPEDLERLQVDAGLPNPPTELTYSYRMAVSGEGELAPTWEDKPHRLVYGLCAHIERIAAEQCALQAEADRLREALREVRGVKAALRSAQHALDIIHRSTGDTLAREESARIDAILAGEG